MLFMAIDPDRDFLFNNVNVRVRWSSEERSREWQFNYNRLHP